MKYKRKSILFLLVFTFLIHLRGAATEPAKNEYSQRRQELMKQAGEGMILLFGNTDAPSGWRFRQDNDFYYFSGIEDRGAVLLMTPSNGESFLFLPEQSAREIMVQGANLLKDPQAKEKNQLTALHPLAYLDEFLLRGIYRYGKTFCMRLSGPDTSDSDRGEARFNQARNSRSHYNDILTLDQHRIAKLRQRYPECLFKDITANIDAMRRIKTQQEIETLKRNGRISAEAVRRAMLASRPGVFEYELEGIAVGFVLQNGARGLAFAPIVASGQNACTWHYDSNSRRMEAGDLVVMDFGANMDYLCMDVTRTWPVSGIFSAEQREIYRAVLEVQKASIEACRPGVTLMDVERIVAETMKRKGIDSRGLKGTLHHFVGLSTHDGFPGRLPLQEGMVLTVEPGLYYPERNIGIRIEDTIVITAGGCEVLTSAVPKEIADIEALLKKRISR